MTGNCKGWDRLERGCNNTGWFLSCCVSVKGGAGRAARVIAVLPGTRVGRAASIRSLVSCHEGGKVPEALHWPWPGSVRSSPQLHPTSGEGRSTLPCALKDESWECVMNIIGGPAEAYRTSRGARRRSGSGGKTETGDPGPEGRPGLPIQARREDRDGRSGSQGKTETCDPGPEGRRCLSG